MHTYVVNIYKNGKIDLLKNVRFIVFIIDSQYNCNIPGTKILGKQNMLLYIDVNNNILSGVRIRNRNCSPL